MVLNRFPEKVYRKVCRVIDGDTFIVCKGIRWGSRTYNTIRIANFNAPEKRTRGWLKAKRELEKFVGKKVLIKPIKRNYNRLVAEVKYNRRNIIYYLI